VLYQDLTTFYNCLPIIKLFFIFLLTKTPVSSIVYYVRANSYQKRKEHTMKRIINIRVAVMVFVGLFVLSAMSNVQAQTPQKHCSNSTFKGSFGLISTGDRIDGSNPGPRATVGLFTADGKGNISLSGTKSKNGTIIENLTATGTYTVNSDCTGSATMTDSDGDSRNFNFVIVDLHHEIFIIQTDEGRVTTGILRGQ
jgi:hypothetical protein